MSKFTDIAIVGADEERTHAPDPSRPAMYDVYLRLSADPPHGWAPLFEQEWQHRLYMKKRRAHVSGDNIVIHCALDEFEKDHLPELRAVLGKVNERYRQLSAQQARREQQAAERQAAAEQEKRDALGRLKFD